MHKLLHKEGIIGVSVDLLLNLVENMLLMVPRFL